MLSVGDYAPSFILSSTDGSKFSSDALENKTILYFYPRMKRRFARLRLEGFPPPMICLKTQVLRLSVCQQMISNLIMHSEKKREFRTTYCATPITGLQIFLNNSLPKPSNGHLCEENNFFTRYR